MYPKLMAWEEAFAAVPSECDGLVVSTEFPVFEIDREKGLPEVLDVYFRDPAVWTQVIGASTGTNMRRRRLNPSDFLRYHFPLPPIQRQHHYRAIAERVDALKTLQSESAAELDALLPAVLAKAFAGEL